MLWLLVLALIAAVVKLWVDVGALRLRVRAMELSGSPTPAIHPDWGIASRTAELEPQPVTTARVVRTVPFDGPAFAPDLRHPGPFGEVQDERELGPSPLPAIEGSATPGRNSPELRRSLRVDETAVASGAALTGQLQDPQGGDRQGNSLSPDSRNSEAESDRVGGDEAHARDSFAPQATPRPAFSFEDVFGRKLPIWAGGITLAVCGLLIVKYSIDAGLLSPLVRIIGGLLFGGGLIAGAEAARQNEDRVRDPRVAQALSGAGVATLYAAILVATNVYDLIPPLAAFVGLAGVTVLAGFLSIRFGAPSAVLGLVGGLAAPALVGAGTPNVPLLAAYLSLAVGGLATLGRAQRWWWLGVAALVGGFGWGLVLILSGALSIADSLSIGLFLLLLGVGLPVLLFGGERGALVRLAGTLAATAQLAALVATGGFAMLNWGLFGLLGIAAVWLSRREKTLADVPALALATALLLMGAWTSTIPTDLALVFGGAAVIFGLPAAWRTWRPDWRISDAASVCALAAAPLGLALWQFDPSDRSATLLALLGTAVAGVVAAAGWRVVGRQDDGRFALLTTTAAVLAMIAIPFALPAWTIAPCWAAIAAVMIVLARAANDRRVEHAAWAIATLTVAPLLTDLYGDGALSQAAGVGPDTAGWRQAIGWSVPAVAALVFARFGRASAAAPVGHAAAVLLGYVAVAQLLPHSVSPLVPALAVAALGWFRRSDTATATAGAIAVAWAVEPFLTWLAGVGGAVLGFPLYVDALPSPLDAGTRLIAPALAAAVVLWRHRPARPEWRRAWLGGLALLGGTALHIFFKQLFALDDTAEFIRLGLAERTVWQASIALAAVLVWRRWPLVARALGLAALAHLTWFSLLLHNPLWSEQAVGPLPFANLLLPLYALGFALIGMAGRLQPSLPPLAERARGWAQMALILLFAASELRQLFHGTIITDQIVGQREDILRSVAAIAVAVGFLLWGLRRQNRDWRIASLVVMLGAVLKVFIFDTSGLDGLLRIASFAALGFSLIGIGWLYSRFLPDGQPVNPSSATVV